ncbi:MAG TPA: FIST N-terminal domain-containing protein [Polyangiaceae bacterium]
MRARSCYTHELDPYRAGLELARSLAAIEPELVFLFPSIHYHGSAELTEALYEGLGRDDLVVVGNTGDGYYEAGHSGDIGVAALGIASAGAMRAVTSCASGVGADPRGAVERCVAGLGEAAKRAQLVFLAVDFRTDSSQVVDALRRLLEVPVVGGLAGDDYRILRCFQYLNREVLEDAIVMVALEGDFAFSIQVAHNLRRVGKPGRVTAAEGVTIFSIDGAHPLDFINDQIGRPSLETDNGIITLMVVDQEGSPDRLRSLLPFPARSAGYVTMVGSIETGSIVQCCLADPTDLVHEVESIGAAMSTLPFVPSAGIIVSCAGRKQLLGGKIRHEVEALLGARWAEQPAIAGYPSFGEFGPVPTPNGYSRNLFHNMTYVLLLLGDKVLGGP